MSPAMETIHVPVKIALELGDSACDVVLRALADAYGQGRDDEAAALPIPEWVGAVCRAARETA